MNIKKLDLHGVRHEDAKRKTIRLVEDNFNDKEVELQIITGHSVKMRSIVLNVLKEYDLSPNIGSLFDLGNPKIVVWF